MTCLPCSQGNHSERAWISYRRGSLLSPFAKLVSSAISNRLAHQRPNRLNPTSLPSASARNRPNPLRSIKPKELRIAICLHQNMVLHPIPAGYATGLLHPTIACTVIYGLLTWSLSQIDRLETQPYTVAICLRPSLLFFVSILTHSALIILAFSLTGITAHLLNQ